MDADPGLPGSNSESVGFSTRSQRALESASDWASKWRHDYIGSEHILLGLMETIPEAFAALSLEGQRVRSALEQAVRGGRNDPDLPFRPFTSRAKELLKIAAADAQNTEFREIEPEHLLLACAQAERTISREVLEQLGVDAGFAADTLTPLLLARRGIGPTGESPA